MSSTFDQIRELIRQGSIRISDHGYDELSADGILARDAIQGLSQAQFLSKIILIIRKVRAYWCEKQRTTGDTFTSSGAYQKVRPNRQY